MRSKQSFNQNENQIQKETVQHPAFRFKPISKSIPFQIQIQLTNPRREIPNIYASCRSRRAKETDFDLTKFW